MTKRTKTYQDPKKLLRSIIIDAGVIAAEYRVATTRSAHKKNTKQTQYEKE